MRLFKHGDSLALVMPPALVAKLNARENQEFEFFELDEGVLVLAKKETLAKQVKSKALADIARLLGSGGSSSPASASPAPAVVLPPLTVFASEAEAKIVAKKFEQQLKTGELIGVAGSDKKVYILSAAFYSATSAKISPLIEKEKSLGEICAVSGLGQKEVFATLQAMKDKGDVIEKKKGSYMLVK